MISFCAAAGAAFTSGCGVQPGSTGTGEAPCWLPMMALAAPTSSTEVRMCTQATDLDVCNSGQAQVYSSQVLCCLGAFGPTGCGCSP